MKRFLVAFILICALVLGASFAVGCDKEKDDGKSCAELGHHTFGEWIEEIPSTCLTVGVKGHYDCVKCGMHFGADKILEIEDLIIPLSNHTPAAPIHENETFPDCTNEGCYDEVVYCSVCQEEISRDEQTVAPLGHKYESGFCIRCSKVDPATCSHNYQETKRVEPTCIKDGYVITTCSICEDVKTETLTKKGHTLGELIPAKAPTCTEEGYVEHYYCSACEKYLESDGETFIYDITVAAKGHTLGVWIAEIPASCTETGVKGHYHCSECGKDLEKNGTTVITNLIIDKLPPEDFDKKSDGPELPEITFDD